MFVCLYVCLSVCMYVCSLYKSTCVLQSQPNSAQGSFGSRGRFLTHRGYHRSMYWAAAGKNRTSRARSGQTVRDINLLMK